MTQPDPNTWTFDLEPGGDFVIGPKGGLGVVTGWNKIRQRIIRRLVTNPLLKLPSGGVVPSDYLFDVNYGIGISQYIDQELSAGLLAQVETAMINGITADQDVDASRPPIITFALGEDSTLFVGATVFLIGGNAQGENLAFEVSQ